MGHLEVPRLIPMFSDDAATVSTWLWTSWSAATKVVYPHRLGSASRTYGILGTFSIPIANYDLSSPLRYTLHACTYLVF